ncbi:hypothetical protein DFP72DRAFT_446503 [Ephemerocybe angulata]|uniref:Uncharacterized protein n=1 Tax=Ephemerocybe angulata TaxID=980116 RepID=A0A8H6HTW4_9AGAR|nr:hypothetical protein DFP72DRAFT_446503 [Tulosesus angulatus]
MRLTLAPLLTVLVGAVALFGFAAAHQQDFTELEARHVPSSYLRSRDLSFSHEDFDTRDGFDAEYGGLQARGEALEVPFQLSLRDFLEEAVEVYRRTDYFQLEVDVGDPPKRIRIVNLRPQSKVDVIFKEAAPGLGYNPEDTNLPHWIELKNDKGRPLISTHTHKPAQFGQTMAELGIDKQQLKFVWAVHAKWPKGSEWPVSGSAPGSGNSRPSQGPANGPKTPPAKKTG